MNTENKIPALELNEVKDNNKLNSILDNMIACRKDELELIEQFKLMINKGK